MIQELQKIVDASSNIVFFGGAGFSTESGIPDFRSVDGLYFQKWDYPPETILSHRFFEANTKEFYRFYKEKMLCLDVLFPVECPRIVTTFKLHGPAWRHRKLQSHIWRSRCPIRNIGFHHQALSICWKAQKEN